MGVKSDPGTKGVDTTSSFCIYLFDKNVGNFHPYASLCISMFFRWICIAMLVCWNAFWMWWNAIDPGQGDTKALQTQKSKPRYLLPRKCLFRHVNGNEKTRSRVKGDEIEGWRLSRVEMLMLMHAIIGNRKDRKSYGGWRSKPDFGALQNHRPDPKWFNPQTCSLFKIRFTAKLFKTTWQEYTKIQLCKFEHWDEVVRMMVFTITGIHSTIFAWSNYDFVVNTIFQEDTWVWSVLSISVFWSSVSGWSGAVFSFYKKNSHQNIQTIRFTIL